MFHEAQSVLRGLQGRLVMVLPDIHDPTAVEDEAGDADVRYMGILASHDPSLLELRPWVQLPRRSDPEREREVALELAPGEVEERDGLRARISKGGATLVGARRSRVGATFNRSLVLPISQVEHIQGYADLDPRQELERLLALVPPLDGQAGRLDAGQAPPATVRARVPASAYHQIMSDLQSKGLHAFHVWASPLDNPLEPLQTLAAVLAQQAPALESAAESLVAHCDIIASGEIATIAEESGAPALTSTFPERHRATLALQREFNQLVGDFLRERRAPGVPDALVIGMPGSSPHEQELYDSLGLGHPNSVWVVSGH